MTTCPECGKSIRVPDFKVFEHNIIETPLATESSAPIVSEIVNPTSSTPRLLSAVIRIVMWIVALLLLLPTIAFLFFIPLASIPVFLTSLIFMPVINDFIYNKYEFKINFRLRIAICIISFISLIVLTIFSTNHQEQEKKRTAQEAQVQKTEKENQINSEYLAVHAGEIQQKIKSLIEQREYQQAIDVASPYSQKGNKLIDSQLEVARTDLKKIQIEQTKQGLLTELSKLEDKDYAEKAKIYQQLLSIDPKNSEYQEKFKDNNAKDKALRMRAQDKAEGLAWNYVQSTDSMTQKSINNAYVSSINTVNFDFPYNGEQHASLQLRDHPRWGKNVILSIQKGQFLCGIEGCSIMVRFDNGKPMKFNVSEPSDNSTNYLFINDYSRFISLVRKSNEVYIEARFFQQGNKVFEFSVDDLDWK